MALRARTPLLLAALAGVVVALRLPGDAEARVLLTLDDFGAVGDGIANDTQVRNRTVALCTSDIAFALATPAIGGFRARIDAACSSGLHSLKTLLRSLWIQALVDAWKAACGTDDNTYLNVPAGKSYQIWPVTLADPCRDEIKLLVHPPSLPTRLPPLCSFLCSAMSHSQYTWFLRRHESLRYPEISSRRRARRSGGAATWASGSTSPA
jgi:hypothetical protein